MRDEHRPTDKNTGTPQWASLQLNAVLERQAIIRPDQVIKVGEEIAILGFGTRRNFRRCLRLATLHEMAWEGERRNNYYRHPGNRDQPLRQSRPSWRSLRLFLANLPQDVAREERRDLWLGRMTQQIPEF